MCRWYCSNLPNGTSTQSPITAPEASDLKPGIVQAVDVEEARKASIGDGAEVRRLLP